MEVEVRKGEINAISGKKIEGDVLFSNLMEYKAKSYTDRYSLKLVLQGSEQYVVNGERKKVNQNQFLLIAPGQELETIVTSKQPVQGVCIYFSEETLEERLAINNSKAPIFPNFPVSASYLNLQNLHNPSFAKNLHMTPDYLLDRALHSLIPYLTHSALQLGGLSVKKETTKTHLWEKLERGKSFIDDNYGSKLHLDQIAEHACVSPFHFQKKFTSFYDISPNQYLMKVRLLHAKKMLNSGSNISLVAEECGFSDIHYLRKCLKKKIQN